MEVTDVLAAVFRWFHIVAGIVWIGLLYWFNWVNIPFSQTLTGDARKQVITELAPRALYFFRWGAMWTWGLGLLLLGLVFYHGGLMFEPTSEGWNIKSGVMLAVTFLMYPVYDALARSPLGKNIRVMGVVGFIIIAIIVYSMINWAEFSYRAYSIHLGAMFGTIMVANVWSRIWPNQKKVIAAIKDGTTPDPALIATTGQRSRHNTYLSVPLVWTMINSHTVVPGADSWLWLLGVTLLGWLLVSLLYARSMKVKGA
jgi:uncharacterized membrane protein